MVAAGFPAIWGEVRGPLGVAYLSLQRLGWTWVGPFEVATDVGSTIRLTQQSPREIGIHLREAYTRHLERKVGASLGVGRVYLGHVAHCLQHNLATPLGKGCLVAHVVGNLWTRKRLWDKGLVDSPLCELCGQEDDTFPHRLLRCQASAVLRDAAPAPFLDRLRDPTDAQGTLLVKRSCLVHPGLTCPLAAEEGDYFWAADGSKLVQPHHFQGMICTDGSCRKHEIPELTRAAWAVVSVDEAGEAAVSSGPVWKGLLQSSQAGEACAYAAASQRATGPTKLVVDFLGIVGAHQLSMAEASHFKKVHAGILKEARCASGFGHIGEVVWQKAHLDPGETGLDPLVARQRKGNFLADHFAKQALSAHPRLSDQKLGIIDDDLSLAKWFATYACAAFSLWGECCSKKVRWKQKALRVVPEAAEPDVLAHSWVLVGKLWRCSMCLAYSYSEKALDARDSVGCPGIHADFMHLTKYPKGHKLKVFDNEEVVIIACSTCGCWGQKRLVKLGFACRLYQTAAAKKDLKLDVILHCPSRFFGQASPSVELPCTEPLLWHRGRLLPDLCLCLAQLDTWIIHP